MLFAELLIYIRNFVLVQTFRLMENLLRHTPQHRIVMVPPIHRLPPELLEKIFSYISQDSTVNPLDLLPITHVCGRWRVAALSSARIWSRIAMVFPVLPRKVSYTIAMLERSGAYPLDILLDLRDPAWDWDEDAHQFGWKEMENVMRLLLPHVQRWKTITILTDTWAPIFTFLWYTKEVKSAPKLESVSLSRCNAFFAAPGQIFRPVSLREPIPFFGGTQLERLRRLTLVGVHVDWGTASSLRNLTHLELEYQASDVMPTWKEFQVIVAGCPMLLELVLDGCTPQYEDVGSLERRDIILPHLQKLSIGFCEASSAVQFLTCLVVPCLMDLTLEDISRLVNPLQHPDSTRILEWFAGGNPRPVGPVDFPSTVISASRFPLHQIQSLELHHILVPARVFSEFSQPFTSVRSLLLAKMEPDILESLATHLPGGKVPFPALRNFLCQDMDAERLVALVHRRAAPDWNAPLQNVTAEFIRTAAPSPGTRNYKALMDSGIQIVEEPQDGASQDSMVA
ncbi:hypothetical protein D9613_001321 [Agrocybe pediades]|uniref:F-box domain-containing protein n=1 Tax=Agrocybe pediades TaxID=84607 RepID=A0A8H4R903_9AGAR|nr:hypothetical protein D9613_001321 [Agrocybe pediades]